MYGCNESKFTLSSYRMKGLLHKPFITSLLSKKVKLKIPSTSTFFMSLKAFLALYSNGFKYSAMEVSFLIAQSIERSIDQVLANNSHLTEYSERISIQSFDCRP